MAAAGRIALRFRLEPGAADTLPGMARALREALQDGRLSWTRYQALREDLPRHARIRPGETTKEPDGTFTVSTYLDPSPEFLEAVAVPLPWYRTP